jgi:Bacterial Ig domain
MSFINHRFIILLFIGIFLSSSVGCGLPYRSDSPQTSVLFSQQEGSLSGYVTDIQMNPLSGALIHVSFHDTYEENYSDSNGYYHVTNIPLCYCLKNATCSKPGYHSQWVLLSISENTTYDFILTGLNETCYPVFNGTMGNHGIYISCVNVTFVINGSVDTVFYKLDSGMWTEYSSTFEVCQNGLHTLYWYWIAQGEESETLLMTLEIDRDSPSLQVSSEWIRFFFTAKIIAIASDETSGVERVEFYIDNELFYVAYDVPYEVTINFFLLQAFYPYDVKVIAFDLAGNQANASISLPFMTPQEPSPILSFLFWIVSFIKGYHILIS